ncbi:MAG: ABC transporter permease subunit [Melioribacteraceae bacterium]|nr:ABC transporter permease subunit [Melioribacteraceae bacterium]MCF8356283.1 ABC transporter permease subunit [Melioribacteraceae bacterium]MCF8394251.1 ABC transporter permease subunit [Melioribacteraceae bacterium]MCF8419972.1 ABC transporter permease subunit [Melioribacteraceae bacterium]
MRKHFLLILSSFILLILAFGCSETNKTLTRLEDLKDISIGAMTGSTGEHLAKTRFPEAETKSFDDIMDGIAALKSGQIDAVITAFPTALNVCKHNPEFMIIEEPVDYENTSIAVKMGNEKLLQDVNEIIAELRADGTLADMKRRWLKNDLSPYEEVDIILPEDGEILKIGTSATREPFCFVDENQRVTGHDGELARRLGSKLNRPIKYYDMKFSALIPALQSGKIDLIVAGMTATEERAKSVNFTTSYFTNSQVVLVKKAEGGNEESKNTDIKLRSLDDLKNKKIGVLLGSVHDTYAIEKFPDAEVLQYKNPPELLLAVRSGKVDAAIYNTETLQEILRGESDLTVFGDTLFTVPIGIGFNKNNGDLKEQFNKFLKRIKADGTFDDMNKRWIINGESQMPVIDKSNVNGELRVGVVSDKGLPFTIIKDNKMIGFDIELAERFAASLGKGVKLLDMEFGSLVAATAANKVDIIASTVMITEERMQQIDFSDPYYRLSASFFALKNNVESIPGTKLKSLDDINGKTVGVYAGTIHDAFVEENFPSAVINRFNTPSDIILSLKSRKIDAAFIDLASAKVMLKSNPDIGILSEDALDLPVAIGFSKNNPELRKQFNEFLSSIKSDGKFDEIYKRWFVDDPEKAVMPKFEFDETQPVIKLGTAVGDLPNSAILNGEHVGFDIEMIKTFAQRGGYNLKILTMEFGSLIAALSSGKVDMIADGIAITEERQKQVAFSDSYNMFKTGVLVLNSNLSGKSQIEPQQEEKEEVSISFFQDILNSFYSNIILENRYILILDGLRTTIIISIFATLFGTILGGLICFMRMSKKNILLIPAKVYISILRGTPVLVVLMIIFYVVFASVDIDPVIVAVIAFGLNFAAYVSEMYRTGIEGVDRGQTEAGIAMGFTKVKTFIYIILPQAVKRILPVYKGEVISLVKMTSIVGYIAVQDLTKASDIIRSRTFDAFFPLIMVAVLYFIISWVLMYSLGYVERLTNPKHKIQRG